MPGGDGHHDHDFQRDFAFAAIDEAQLGIDPERGHVFTDRMLRVRGREETLILGSDTLKPVVRKLLPEAEIVSRPRFSTLRFAGSVKLSRLPPRSAVVAFSAEQVYALAEMLRRFKGGAAVVMGALSPATRNAQVAMFQRGEVDYLVATDAIGMGLNMDVTHVAFAGLEKFDGRRDRRLTIAEMAQIAGRAGRHQKDGSFGTLGLTEDTGGFSEEETAAIEDHRFRPLDFLYWRNAELDFGDVGALIASLEPKSDDPLLESAPRSDRPRRAQADRRGPGDRRQAGRAGAAAVGGVRAARFPQGRPDAPRADGPPALQLRRRGRPHPARMVRGRGRPARQCQRRHRGARRPPRRHPQLGLYRASRRLADRARRNGPNARARSRGGCRDALHERLTQRFVDRRTAVLVRDIGARGADALPVTVAADGEVSVGPEPIGHLTGFEFRVDPSARLADKRLLLAAAERRLGDELERRATALVEAPDDSVRAGRRGRRRAGGRLGGARPRPARARPLAARAGAAHRARARPAVGAQPRRACAPGSKPGSTRRSLAICARSRRSPRRPPIRPARPACARSRRCWPTPAALLPRKAVLGAIAHLEQADRQALHNLRVRLGPLDVYVAPLLKPAAQYWRAALLAVRTGQPMPALPPPGAATLGRRRRPARRRARLSPRRTDWLRIDLADRLASHARKVRSAGGDDPVDAALATSIGLDEEAIAQLMDEVGFTRAGDAWRWRGRRPPRDDRRGAGVPRFRRAGQTRSG